MNDTLEKLLASLKGTSTGTRVIVGLVGLALTVIAGLAAVVVNKPHFELAFSGLTDHELAQVCKALADAGIPFQQSQPPGPFIVYVDGGNRSAAYMAAYSSGALDKPLEGILAGGGMTSVFNSAEERAQGVRKREWQEMEKMLAELDFVVAARVRTSTGSSSPLLGGSHIPITASVALRIAGEARLTPEQAETIANLVSRGLGIAKGDLMISDQAGRSLYDGEKRNGNDSGVEDMLAHQAEFDHRLSREANLVLERILGPNKAHVSISSEWDFAQTTVRNETTQKGAVVQETKTSSEKPSGSASGVRAGLSPNTLDPNAPTTAADIVAPVEASMEKTSEETKSYAPSVSRMESVRLVPELKRLSIALFLDESVQGASLEEAVKAAVGFNAERNDSFTAVKLSFVTPEEVPEEAETPGVVPSKTNPMMETLLKRGVEIASAVVFLILLARTLRGAKKGRKGPAVGAQEAEVGDQVDPELLARAQVDELLKSDPARVGEILSRWAREETVSSR